MIITYGTIVPTYGRIAVVHGPVPTPPPPPATDATMSPSARAAAILAVRRPF